MASEQPLSAQIRASGTYRFTDHLRALIADMYPTTMHLVLYCVVGLLFLALGVAGFKGEKPVWGTFFVLLGLAVLVGSWVLILFLAYRSWTGTPHRKTTVEILLDDQGLAAESAFGSGKTLWGAIVKWQETRHLFLVYMSRTVFFIVPKRFLPDMKDVYKARKLLSEKVVPHGDAR